MGALFTIVLTVTIMGAIYYGIYAVLGPIGLIAAVILLNV
jgi:hypothetical protein